MHVKFWQLSKIIVWDSRGGDFLSTGVRGCSALKGLFFAILPQWRGANIWVCPNEGVPIIWVCPNEGVPIIWVCSSEGLYFCIYMFTFLSIKWIQLEHKYSFNWFFQWKLQLIKCPYCTPQWRVFILNRPNEGVYIWKFAPMKGCKFGNSPQWRGINLEIRPSEGSPYIFLRRAPPYIYNEVPSPGMYTDNRNLLFVNCLLTLTCLLSAKKADEQSLQVYVTQFWSWLMFPTKDYVMMNYIKNAQ